MGRANIIVPVVLLSNFFVTGAFAETIIKDSNGIEYLADQIILKIKSGPVKGAEQTMGESRRLTSLTQVQASVQSLAAKWGVTESEALFSHVVPPTEKMNLSSARRAAKQREFEKLGNTFLLKLPAGADVRAALAEFAENPEVEYAEPVYIFRLCMEPNDLLFSQQWYLHNTGQYYLADADIDAPEAWEINQGSANPVISIIDTGVDLDHPDLVNQIWQNPNEQSGDGNGDGCPGWCGFDDDGDGLIDEDSAGRQPGEPGYNNDLVNDDDENGYKDDFFGWNWIDDHNNPQDDQGHGTHCAGIAAADTNNGIGIAGVCPNGRIMSLKAFQSSGTASNIDIASAITYAYQNGAQVISMSFTLGADSALVRNALELAYSTSVLVAAAGNLPQHSGIRYPAYYWYVIGVGATDVAWDDETSSYKEIIAPFTNTINTDIYAPGVSIRSTLLDDTYASWSGTSMATPVVAGIAGLLASEHTDGFWGPDLYQGQIVNSGEGTANRINAVTALTQVPEPHLVLESYVIDDSTGDGDGIPDANETVDLYFTIRNTYGNATGVTATLSTSDVMASVIDPNANYGNIGPSASDDNAGDPITVHISPDAGNNRDIVSNFQADANTGGSGIDEDIVLTIQRGVEISGVFDENTTLVGHTEYIVTGNILVPEGITLTIEPRSIIRIEANAKIYIYGTLVADAAMGESIVFRGNQGYWEGFEFGNNSPQGVVDSFGAYISGCVLRNCIIKESAQQFIKDTGGGVLCIDCLFEYNEGNISSKNGQFEHCVFRNNRGQSTLVKTKSVIHSAIHTNDNFQNTVHTDTSLTDCLVAYNNHRYDNEYTAAIYPSASSNIVGSAIFANTVPIQQIINMRAEGTSGDEFDMGGNYWVTTSISEIEDTLIDYDDGLPIPDINVEPILSGPPENTPPFVAQVLFQPSGTIAPGSLEVTAIFSRDMNTSLQPIVTFGVVEPFTQHMVSDGNWIDARTWQSTYPITLFTGDGLQTIRVSGAKASDPNFWFEIPVDTRFGFEIDTAGVSGVNLQASGEAGRVDLYYNPVNEPDLAGYNIYRSDGSGGPYTKINPAVVLDTTYSDYTAPQGITKYYVVTAVRTDFDESDYSDEANATAQDGTPPDITHAPVLDRDIVGPPGITIQATITDNPGTGVASATLYYKKTSEASYSSLAMNNPSGDLWSLNIPGAAITLEGIDYYIAAEDNSPYSDTAYHGTHESPHHIIVYTEKCGPLSVPAGPSSQSYCTTDVTIDIHSNDTAGEVTVYRMEANAPNVNEPSLQRHWAITGLEGSTFSADLIFSYTDAALAAAGLDEGNLILRKSADGGRTYQVVHATTESVGNTIATTYEQTSFSIWTISEFVCGDFGFPPADIDENCYVDFGDFAVLGNQWRQPPGIPSADIAPEGGDGVVDSYDLDVVAEHWLEDSLP